MKSFSIAVISLVLFFMVSCKSGDNNSNDNTTINPETVNNPASAEGAKSGKLPAFQFEEETHNFGNIVRGEKISYSFKFKNVGEADLIINSATASCGCTVPDYPKTPIKPGDEGYIHVTFNSEGRQGVQNKTITIIANTVPNTKVLKITCNVIAPE